MFKRKNMRHGSLFSGIGGFDLASEWMGWENVFHCEINDFCQKILKHYWKDAKSYTDITTTDFTIHRGNIDILTGGFPCQPFSQAGRRLGTDDPRYLWKEMLRAIREIRPKWVVGENVYGLVNWNRGLVFRTVVADLENEGYTVIPIVLPAAGKNAPHNRARIWFIAYQSSEGLEGGSRERIQGDFIRHTNIINEWTSSDTDNNGCNEHDNEYEIRPTDGRINAFNDFDEMPCQESSSDSECDGLRFSEDTRNIRENQAEMGRSRSDSSESTQADGSERNATNTNSEVFQGRNLQGETGRRTDKEERTQSFGRPGEWEEFPTVSPICVRDDGFSNRLDGITFPKWRNESIRGAGNAVVPQIPFEIFKVIQQIENEKSTT